MIFLDTNIILRYLTTPTNTFSARAQEVATELLENVRAGRVEVFTTELVIHEVLIVATSRRHYGMTAALAIQLVRPLIRYRSMRFSPGEKDIILRALDIWERNPKLEFADSAIAARCEANRWELATFDEELGSLPGITRWSADPAQ